MELLFKFRGVLACRVQMWTDYGASRVTVTHSLFFRLPGLCPWDSTDRSRLSNRIPSNHKKPIDTECGSDRYRRCGGANFDGADRSSLAECERSMRDVLFIICIFCGCGQSIATVFSNSLKTCQLHCSERNLVSIFWQFISFSRCCCSGTLLFSTLSSYFWPIRAKLECDFEETHSVVL